MMNSQEQQMEQVEVSIEKAREGIRRLGRLNKLTANTDFKELILEGYFEQEASRLVLLKASPNMQDDAAQKAIILAIDSIGHFRQHLYTIMHVGRMAQKALADDEETREQLLSEVV